MSKRVLIAIVCLLAPVSVFAQVGGAGGGKSGEVGVKLNNLLSCEDQLNSVCRIESQWEYETVAASQTDQVFGTTGAAGDLLHAVHCVWTAASAGVVSVKDGAGAAINIFDAKGAAGSQTVLLDMISADGGWKLTTSTSVTCLMIGRAT